MDVIQVSLFVTSIVAARFGYRMLSGPKKKVGGPFDLNKVARGNILELEPYRCARDDYNEGILLDANENSIGPAANVEKYAHLNLNRYPDPFHLDIKEKFGKLRKVRKEQIFFGVGSDEAIDILLEYFAIHVPITY